MLMVVMYHHVDSDDKALSNSPELLREHFEYIKKRYNIVLPGEDLKNNKMNICLTFDDAYYDFYHYVYPMLKELNMKAMLAVPTKYILKNTLLNDEVRLSLNHNAIYEEDNYQKYASFCTFEEIKEMQNSGLVEIASHGHEHVVLSSKGVDLEKEVVHSKTLLEKELGCKVSTFILPYGKYNEEVVKVAKEHYACIMRIGNALNSDFLGIKGLVYRVKGDDLKDVKSIFKWTAFLRFYWKNIVKRLFG